MSMPAPYPLQLELHASPIRTLPVMVMLTDTRRGIAVIRAALLGLCLAMSAMLMGARAGTFKCLVPQVSLADSSQADPHPLAHHSFGLRAGEVLFPEKSGNTDPPVETVKPVRQSAKQRAENISAPEPASIAAPVKPSP